MDKLPRWADVVLVPLICLIIAFVFCGILIAAIGQSPLHAIWIMIDGAFGSTNGLGYTLYYATNFIFTGLAVSIAFQASLFNIGGEGQATLGGLGVALSCLLIPWPHWSLARCTCASRSKRPCARRPRLHAASGTRADRARAAAASPQ